MDNWVSFVYKSYNTVDTMPLKRFWMVWSPQGDAPTVKHPSHENALMEAKRLANAFPTREFYVLVAEKRVKRESSVKVKTLS